MALSVPKALEPLGDSKPNWQILSELAAKLGHDWRYRGPSEIIDEIASLTPRFAAVNQPRLEGDASLVWPVATDGSDTLLLYETSPDGKARLYPLEWLLEWLRTGRHLALLE